MRMTERRKLAAVIAAGTCAAVMAVGGCAHAVYEACVSDPALESRCLRAGAALIVFGISIFGLSLLGYAVLADDEIWTGPTVPTVDGDGEGGHASVSGSCRGSGGAETSRCGGGHS